MAHIDNSTTIDYCASCNETTISNKIGGTNEIWGYRSVGIIELTALTHVNPMESFELQ